MCTGGGGADGGIGGEPRQKRESGVGRGGVWRYPENGRRTAEWLGERERVEGAVGSGSESIYCLKHTNSYYRCSKFNVAIRRKHLLMCSPVCTCDLYRIPTC